MVKLNFNVAIRFRAFFITFADVKYSVPITLTGEAAVLEGILSPLLSKVKYNDHGVQVSLTQV